MVDCHTKQLETGLTPEEIKFSTSLPILRNASVAPVVNLYKWAQGPAGRELIQRVWYFNAHSLLLLTNFLGLGEMRGWRIQSWRSMPYFEEKQGGLPTISPRSPRLPSGDRRQDRECSWR
jgi:hypothetical protein